MPLFCTISGWVIFPVRCVERNKRFYANHFSVPATSFSDETPRKRGCCFWYSDSVQNYRKKCAKGKIREHCKKCVVACIFYFYFTIFFGLLKIHFFARAQSSWVKLVDSTSWTQQTTSLVNTLWTVNLSVII